MRLTLRTLLAYLDDALKPSETKEIGRKVSENETAQELIARIKQVTRRRRLTTPEMGGPGGAVDPNMVAEYLDNVLTPDQVAQLERLCLESDVHLAEVAACHQILSLDSESVQVPPTAKQRMYGLVQGPEAQLQRKPARPKTEISSLADSQINAEADEALLLGLPLYRQSGTWQQRILPLATAAALLLGLGIVLYFALKGPTKGPDIAQKPAEPGGMQPLPLATSPLPPPPKPSEEEVTALVGNMLASLNRAYAWREPASDIATPVVAAAPWISRWTVVPPNLLAGFGIAGELEPPVVVPLPPPMPMPLGFPQIKPIDPTALPAAIGQHASALTKDSLLLRQVSDKDWRLVRPKARINTVERLVTLPGYRSELKLDNGIALEMVGNLSANQPPDHVLETVLQIHANPDVDLDLTLDRGRLVLTGKPDKPSLIRVRFHDRVLGPEAQAHDQVWDLRLKPRSMVALEVTRRITRANGTWEPRVTVSLTNLDAELELRIGSAPQAIPPNQLVFWDTELDAEHLVLPRPNPDAWITKKEPIPEEIRTATTLVARRLVDKLDQAEQEMPWIKAALEEAVVLDRSRPTERRLGLYGLAAINHLGPVLASLQNPDREVRRAAMDTLHHWLGRRANQHQALRPWLGLQGYSEEDAEAMLLLLRGFARADKTTLNQLLDYLGHKKNLAIRELAWSDLQELAPAAREVRYDPAGTTEVREAGITALRNKLQLQLRP